MERDFFLNAPTISIWQTEFQSPDFFVNSNYEKSTDQYTQFDSALSSLVSSPAASNSNDSSSIRELIGKLGNICQSTNTSCYTTPLNSPPKLNLPNLGNLIPSQPALPELSADPGFAERAAKFSCFGSRSFNGRTNQFNTNNAEYPLRSSSSPLENGKLGRISSSPALNALGSQVGVRENKNSPLQDGIHVEMKSCEESSVCVQTPLSENGSKGTNDSNSRKRKGPSRGKGKEPPLSPSPKATKVSEKNDESNRNGGVKVHEETKGSDSKPPEPPKDYIHVRARRGQATDSHSLAERVRREKISERMKLLQDLVPGCNKVTGKALMLDEIINYVQSLQRQVEFLSMKLASVNPGLDVNMETLISKEMFQSNDSLSQPMYSLDSSALAFTYGHQSQQSLHSNISNGSLTISDGLFAETHAQIAQFCEDDLQSIVQMGFGQQHPTGLPAFQPRASPAQMKHSS